MKREQIASVASLAITVVLVLAIGVLPFVSAHRSVDYSSYQSAADEYSTERPWEIGSVAAAAVAAVFAGVLALLNGIQIGDTRRSSERQLRAYVGVLDSSVRNLAETKSPTAYITLKNSGQTPAYEFYATIGVTICEYPLPEGLALPSPLVNFVEGRIVHAYIGTGLVAPGHQICMSQAFDRPISQEVMDALKAGKKAYFAYGYARYRDAFDRYWQLDYRYISGGPTTIEHLYRDQVTEKQIEEHTHRATLTLSGFSTSWPKSVLPPAEDGHVD